nr:reverse transcriptase domain-containing protein [Tanacetum cinerariifolium]
MTSKPKTKATPRRLANADSDKEALARGLLPRTKNRHTQEGQEGCKSGARKLKGKGPSLEGKGIDTKKQAWTLNMRRAKLPRNIRVYEGNKDPDDHLGIFSVAAEQKEWLMPIWCKMFRQTLGGAARKWFDDLDPKSVDRFEELNQKFLEEFLQQKRYCKDPTEIHGIKRRQNESLQAFMDRFKSESSHIKGVPLILHISTFMHGHAHPKLAKKLNDKIPNTMDEMFERVRAFIRREVTACSTEMLCPFLRDKRNARLAWEVGPSGKGYLPEQPEERGLRKEERIPRNRLTDEPIILEGRIEDHHAKTKKMQSSVDRFLRRNVPPFENNRPSSNYGKGRKEQYGANGIYNKKLCRNANSWKGCKVHGMRVEEGKFLGHMVTKEGFIPKLAELKYPINNVRMRLNASMESGWTNEAEEALQMIERKLNKLQTLAILKEREKLMLCTRQRNKTISPVLMVEREGVQAPVSYVSKPLQGMKICYTPTEKMIQALIHTTRSLRTTFRKHKTYDISYIQRKEVKGSIVKNFFGQGEQVQKTPDANEGETPNLRIIQVSPVEKMHSYDTRLNFNASDHAMDCEALLVGLVAPVNKGMKDLHTFIDSLTLVAQIEGNHTPAIKKEKKYNEEVMDATALFYRGKDNEIYILQSIDHGSFELGTTRDTLGTTPERGVLLRPERPHTYDDLNDNEKK